MSNCASLHKRCGNPLLSPGRCLAPVSAIKANRVARDYSHSQTGTDRGTASAWAPVVLLGALGMLACATPVSAQTTVEVRVSSGDDDAEQQSGSGQMNLSSSDLELVVDGSYDINAVRFTGVAVPQGATISNAYIQFQCDETSTGVSSLTIRGQDIDDASVFTSTAYDISSRTVTTASVAWSPPDWSTVGEAGVNQQTADISSILQEIVDRPGWVPGNDIVIIFTGLGRRAAESYNGLSSAAPLLHLEHDGEPVTYTYYVRPDGNNSNTGLGPSASEAWRTVAAAVDKTELQPGDVVYVMSGTYSGTVSPSESGSSSMPLRYVADTDGSIFTGAGGDVVLRGSEENDALAINGYDYLEFEGFTLRGHTESNLVVDLDNSLGIKLTRCKLYDGDSGGIDSLDSELDVINCLVYNNNSYGIRVRGTSSVATIWNSTIVDNSADGLEVDNGTVTLTNSILANNGDAGMDLNGGTLTHTYNLVYGNSGGNYEGTSASTGEISADPQFLSATDYHLEGDSPAVDSGFGSGGVPGDDLEGRIRPLHLGYDMGCYEGWYLVGHWTFDEGTGTTIADVSEYGNDASFNIGTPTWDSGVRGGALDFDGSNDARTSSSFDAPSDGSVAFWFRSDSLPAGTERLFGIGGNWEVRIEPTGEVYFDLGGEANGTQFRTDPGVAGTGEWRHVVAIFSASADTFSLYLDGEFVKAGTINLSPQSAALLSMGARTGSSERFDGTLDDLRIYSRGLSAIEVAELYGLIGHWRMDEGAGSTAADATAFGNDATLSGASWTSDCGGNYALEFDGLADTAVTGSDFEPPATGAVAFWMRSAGNPAARSRPFGLDDNWEVRQETDGTLSFDLGGEGPPEFVTTEGLSDENRWHHVVAQFDESDDSFSVYVDGQLQTTGTNSTDIVEQAENVLTFGTRTGSSQYWNGALRDFRIYNRYLLNEEIAELSQTGGHWRMDELSGSVAVDDTVLGNDGIFVNTPTLGVASVAALENGTAVQYDGSSQYTEIPHHDAMLADNGTVMFWFRTAALMTEQGLFSKDSSGYDTGGHLTIRLVSGKVDVRLQSTTTSHTVESGVIAAPKWRHVAFTWGVQGMNLYVDGLLVDNDATYTGGLGTTSGGSGNYEPIVLGANAWVSGDLVATPVQDYLQGAIDDARFQARAMCADEIYRVYRGGRSSGVRIMKWVEVR